MYNRLLRCQPDASNVASAQSHKSQGTTASSPKPHNAKESSRHKNVCDRVHMASDTNIPAHTKFIKCTDTFLLSLITQERFDQYVAL